MSEAYEWLAGSAPVLLKEFLYVELLCQEAFVLNSDHLSLSIVKESHEKRREM